MPAERSTGIIFYRNTPQGRRYLILRSARKGDRPEFWDIPKGLLEDGEKKAIDAAVREAREESGISDFSQVREFKHTVSYFTRREGKPVPKFVAVFLAEAKSDKVKLSWEHDAYLWASFEEAIKKLSPMRPAMKAAEEFLNQK